MEPIQIITGFLVGALVGLTGIGGGALMTPVLVLGLGVQPTVAVGTDLFYASITKFAGTGAHIYQKTVDWKIVGLLASGSLLGSAISGWLFDSLQETYGEAMEPFIARLLGIILVLMALFVFATTRKSGAQADRNGPEEAVSPRLVWILPLTGFVVGVLTTFTSVGSGAIVCAALFALAPRMQVARNVGSQIAHAALLLPVAAVGHSVMGNVDYHLAANLLVGSVPGVIIGSFFVRWIHDGVLKITVSGIMLLAGLKMI